VVRDAVNLRVRGQGVAAAAGSPSTNLWFAPGAGVEVLSCHNASVGGFSMDTVAPPFSQGRLRTFDAASSSLLVEIEADFPLPTQADPSGLFNETCPDGSAGVCGEIQG
jgi:hypothetical protein